MGRDSARALKTMEALEEPLVDSEEPATMLGHRSPRTALSSSLKAAAIARPPSAASSRNPFDLTTPPLTQRIPTPAPSGVSTRLAARAAGKIPTPAPSGPGLLSRIPPPPTRSDVVPKNPAAPGAVRMDPLSLPKPPNVPSSNRLRPPTAPRRLAIEPRANVKSDPPRSEIDLAALDHARRSVRASLPTIAPPPIASSIPPPSAAPSAVPNPPRSSWKSISVEVDTDQDAVVGAGGNSVTSWLPKPFVNHGVANGAPTGPGTVGVGVSGAKPLTLKEPDLWALESVKDTAPSARKRAETADQNRRSRVRSFFTYVRRIILAAITGFVLATIVLLIAERLGAPVHVKGALLHAYSATKAKVVKIAHYRR